MAAANHQDGKSKEGLLVSEIYECRIWFGNNERKKRFHFIAVSLQDHLCLAGAFDKLINPCSRAQLSRARGRERDSADSGRDLLGGCKDGSNTIELLFESCNL